MSGCGRYRRRLRHRRYMSVGWGIPVVSVPGYSMLLRLMPGLVDLECVVVLRNVKLDVLEH